MTQFDYDLFVIGAGSGGVRASRVAAAFGARVAIAEADRFGGTCVIRGCVPKKLLVYASQFPEAFADARGFGWTVGETKFSWPALIAAKDREIGRLEGVYRKLLEGSGVTIFAARARLADPHTIEVAGRRVTAKNILVATGGRPFTPDIPGRELGITSNEAFHLPDLPKRVLVVGGGYIAVEFSGIFEGLGSQVTLAYRGAEILRGFDDDVRHFLDAEMKKKGIEIRLNADLLSIARRADGALDARLKDGKTVTCDGVMFATGRIPNTAGLGLAEVGVALGPLGEVKVDELMRTSVQHIFAVGDVTHRVQLTPVAIREGTAVATMLFGGKDVMADHTYIPTAVFSQPPIGTVGLTEQEAIAACGEVDVYKADFKPMKNTLGGRDERTLMKLIVDARSQRVLGAHMVGENAPEIIQGIGIAVKAGLTKQQFDATVGIHPTAAEEFVTLKDPKRVGVVAR
jgi:glutathione reductase (NADPH)